MIYEYKCNVCGGVISIERPIFGMEETPICCQQTTSRLWSSPAIAFKGDGFYTTDK